MTDDVPDLRREMPVVARHEGVWEGEYAEVAPDRSVLDEFETRVRIEFPDEGPYPYRQHNRYRWPDGSEATHEFPGRYEDGRLVFDTERLTGRAWEAAHDDRSVYLTWTRTDVPDVSFHEMITIAPGGDERARTWHWFDGDGLIKRTLVEERRVE